MTPKLALPAFPVLLVLLGGALLLVVAGILLLAPLPPTVEEEYHIHGDFAMYLNGQKFDFAQEKYMDGKANTENNSLIHLHDMAGDVIHVHAMNKTLGDFFTDIGMKFETTNDTITFTTDTGETYTATRFGCFKPEEGAGKPTLCVDPAPNAIMFNFIINGKPYEDKIEDYVMEDLDRILIQYGVASELNTREWYSLVTDNACIQSGTCPERGEPSDESTCTSAGGCAVGEIPIGA